MNKLFLHTEMDIQWTQQKINEIYLIIIMQLQRAQQVASNAIDAIVTKGTQKLYENYIKQKIPNHTFQQASQLVQKNFGLFFQQTFQSGVIAKDRNPFGGFNDTIVPFKVQKGDRFRQTLHDRNAYQTSDGMNKKVQRNSGRSTMIQSERTDRNSASIKIRQKNIIKSKPLMGMSLNPEEILENESSLRKQREKNKREELKKQKETKEIQKQKQMNKVVLQTKIKQLQKHGVPYYYNNEGQIQSPKISDFKYQTAQNEKFKRRNRITSLHCQTLQLSFAQRYLKDIRFLIGRKKGYFSTQRNKKLKMTNEEFNNDNDRQCSTIPYLALVEGVKVIQRQRNIIAQKNRKPSLQLSQYKQKANQTMFKSFVSEYQTIQATHRPFTTQFERSNKPGIRGKDSLLWKPQTASKGCRLNINNQQLAKSVIE